MKKKFLSLIFLFSSIMFGSELERSNSFELLEEAVNFFENLTDEDFSQVRLQEISPALPVKDSSMHDEVISAETTVQVPQLSTAQNNDETTRTLRGRSVKKVSYCELKDDFEDEAKQEVAFKKEQAESNSSYVCKECGKCFTRTYSLMVHQRVHNGERPYGCQTCGKTFAQKFCLRRHEQLHTGERPYVCEFCGCDFAQKVHLERHMDSKHTYGK